MSTSAECKRIDFVCAGTLKSGTSWLEATLRLIVNDMLPAHTKETFFFDRHYHLGMEWYERLFAPGIRNVGEVSPSYFTSSLARERLREANAHCRIILALRNPYDRAVSHILHGVRRGEIRVARGNSLELSEAQHEAIGNHSSYGTYVPRWKESFPERPPQIILFEDLTGNPARVLQRLCEELGVPYSLSVEDLRNVDEGSRFRSLVPRHPGLSALALRLSRSLQDAGMVRLVGALRQSPLRRLIERPREDQCDVRLAATDYVRRQFDFSEDVDFCRRLTGRSLEGWVRP